MNSRVLYVDDDQSMLRMLNMLNGYPIHQSAPLQIETKQDAEQALTAVANSGPYAVILSDMNMPGMNGVEFLRWVRQIVPDSIRMMLTGCLDLQVAVDAVNEGNVFRFMSKPVSIETLVKVLHAGIEQYRLVGAEKELLEKTLAGSISAVTEILALADPIAFGRVMRVRPLVRKIAVALGADNPWQYEVAAMLSQVACITVADSILRQVYRGDTLTPDDALLFESHPQVGQRLIANIPRLEGVAEAIAYQEKRFDGSGPPADDRAGADIPLAARVLKVALDFDKLDTKELSRADAVNCLRQKIGWYDPVVLDALGAALQIDSQMVMQEISVKDLIDQLLLLDKADVKLKSINAREDAGGMVLAEDIWFSNQRLALSKGHEITPVILRRLEEYARRGVITKAIRVLVPAGKTL